MGRFEEQFRKFFSFTFPNVTDPVAINEIRRVFYAGAFELLSLFESTSADPLVQERQTLQLRDEIHAWMLREITTIVADKVRDSNAKT